MSISMRMGVKVAALLLFVFASVGLGSATSWSQSDPVGEGPDFNNPRGIAAEANGDFVVADFGNGNIYRVDGLTGNRFILSDNSDMAQGDPLGQPAGIVVLPDGRIFVSDLALSSVVEIDAVTGARYLLAGGDGSILAPFGLAAGILDGRMTLVVADTGSLPGEDVVGPLLVDPDTGAITALRIKRNNKILYNDPRSVAVLDGDAYGNDAGRILVANFGVGEVISVHPVSGTRKMISQNASGDDAGVGSGNAFSSISDIAVSADGGSLIVVDLGSDAIVSVDLKKGNRTVLSTSAASPVGSGADFRSPHGIEVDGDGYMITDFGIPGIIFVAADGTRSLFSTTPVNGFVGIRDISPQADGTISTADFGGNRIFLVDPVTGERFLVASGAPFNGPVSAIELDDATLAVSQFQSPALIHFVDKATGTRSVLSEPGVRGSGPAVAARGFILDPNDANRILATSFNEDAVIAIDISTGDRTFQSKDGVRGGGVALNNPLGIAVDPFDGTIYVSDLGANAIFAIDADGNRSILSSNSGVGAGPNFARPFGVSVIDGEIFVADASGVIRVDAATGDRTMVSPGGPLFAVRKRDADSLFVANFGGVQGIEIVDKATGARSILSNADNP